LDDVTVFMHAHQITWHNNDFLDSDSALMVQHLQHGYVVHTGYMNLRCHQDPGCPDHIHPVVGNENDDFGMIPEAAVFGSSWKELFPHDPIPRVLSQPCCGQFAVSSDAIRKFPQESYVAYRKWLLGTELDDSVSGRVWEYVWQWLFSGQAEFCPAETACYCDGYGLCFNQKLYTQYFELRDQARALEAKAEELTSAANGTSTPEIDAMREKAGQTYRLMDDIKAIWRE